MPLTVSPDEVSVEIRNGAGVTGLASQAKAMLEAYGAWGEKTLYGRKFMGVIRKTFLIDGQGRVRQVWPKVKVDGHAEEVLETVRAL